MSGVGDQHAITTIGAFELQTLIVRGACLG
jgi:hypothetical protein